MVYITNWQDFQEAAESLYEKAPRNTRYCVKWRAVEGVLVLKITDDTTCLKYKTHSSIFLNRFETLNLSLMRKMQNRKAASSLPEPVAAEATPIPGASNLVPTPVGPVSGGVKKKKGKKKK